MTLCINCDVHHPSAFGLARYGVAQARRGWATKCDVLNTLPIDELQARLKRSRNKHR